MASRYPVNANMQSARPLGLFELLVFKLLSYCEKLFNFVLA